MPRWRCLLIALMIVGAGSSFGLAQEAGPRVTTIKGVLTIIKGDVYTMQDLSGRFVQFRVDQSTQRERLVVPGERIEIQLSPDGRALSIKPVQ